MLLSHIYYRLYASEDLLGPIFACTLYTLNNAAVCML